MATLTSSLLPRPPSHGTVARCLALSLGVFVALALDGCSSAPTNYATPEAAVDSLVGALRAGDQDGLHKILGSDADKLLSSGDEIADRNGQAVFLKAYDEKHRLTPDGDDSMTLEVGNTDWPTPVPIVKGEHGWYFDTEAGLDEMLSRRIGRNELFVIQVCLTIIDAEKEFAAADNNGDGWRDYARRFNSEAGKKNGLYWPSATGERESPLGPLVAAAEAEGYGGGNNTSDTSRPFHGYYFRILTKQGDDAPGGALDYVDQGHMIGGFGIVAWPVEYGNSGLKTFIASHHGVVYQNDLGDNTDSAAKAIAAFNPGTGWERCDTSVEP